MFKICNFILHVHTQNKKTLISNHIKSRDDCAVFPTKMTYEKRNKMLNYLSLELIIIKYLKYFLIHKFLKSIVFFFLTFSASDQGCLALYICVAK